MHLWHGICVIVLLKKKTVDLHDDGEHVEMLTIFGYSGNHQVDRLGNHGLRSSSAVLLFLMNQREKSRLHFRSTLDLYM